MSGYLTKRQETSDNIKNLLKKLVIIFFFVGILTTISFAKKKILSKFDIARSIGKIDLKNRSLGQANNYWQTLQNKVVSSEDSGKSKAGGKKDKALVVGGALDVNKERFNRREIKQYYYQYIKAVVFEGKEAYLLQISRNNDFKSKKVYVGDNLIKNWQVSAVKRDRIVLLNEENQKVEVKIVKIISVDRK